MTETPTHARGSRWAGHTGQHDLCTNVEGGAPPPARQIQTLPRRIASNDRLSAVAPSRQEDFPTRPRCPSNRAACGRHSVHQRKTGTSWKPLCPARARRGWKDAAGRRITGERGRQLPESFGLSAGAAHAPHELSCHRPRTRTRQCGRFPVYLNRTTPAPLSNARWPSSCRESDPPSRGIHNLLRFI